MIFTQKMQALHTRWEVDVKLACKAKVSAIYFYLEQIHNKKTWTNKRLSLWLLCNSTQFCLVRIWMALSLYLLKKIKSSECTCFPHRSGKSKWAVNGNRSPAETRRSNKETQSHGFPRHDSSHTAAHPQPHHFLDRTALSLFQRHQHSTSPAVFYATTHILIKHSLQSLLF